MGAGSLLQRAFEIVLVAAILIGAVLVFQSSSLRSELTREHARLMAKTGSLTIKDPTQAQIQAIETGEPLSYAWRVYLPPNYSFAYRCSSGGGSGSQSAAWEGIFRFRIKAVGDDFRIYYRFAGGSGMRGLGSPQLKELFDKNPELAGKLVVEQLGKNELATFDPSEVKTLIKVALPEEMLQELKPKLNQWEYERIETIEWMRIGSSAAVAKDTVKLN